MEIFKLFGSIFVDNEKANASISKTDEVAEKLSTKFVNGVKTVGMWGTAIVGASTVVGGALLGVANNSASAMDTIDKMSAKIGISKQGYQEWSYVMGQNGMDIEKLQVGMKTLVSQMDGVTSGNKNAIAMFEKLGLSVYDSTGKLKDQETMMNETMYALANMENGTEKARLSTELFGKSGVEMMPMLNGGAEGMKELTKRAHELGLVVSDEAVTSGVVFGDTMDDLKQSFTMVATNVGNKLIPVFQSLADWVIEHMPQIQSAIEEVSNFIGKVIDIAITCIDWVKENIDTVILLVEAVGLLVLAWGGFKFGELFNSFKTMKDGLLAWQMSTHGASVSTGLLNGSLTVAQGIWALLTGQMTLSEVKTYAVATAQKLLNAVMSANPIGLVIAGITLLVGALVLAYNKSETFRNMVNSLWETIKTTFTNIGSTVVNTFTNAYNKGVSLFTSLKDKVSGIIEAIKGFFKFTISFPKIKLPHFSVKPKGWEIGDLLKGKIPTLGVEWYAKAMNDGMILNDATIFGMQNGKLLGGGEKGSETVVGTQSLLNMIQQAVSQSNNALAPILMKIYELISDEDKIHRLLVKALTDGSFSVVLDGREVGRIVRNYA